MKKEIILNNEEYSALCSVVDYLYNDELKHYEENSDDENFIKHHIWHSVKILSLKVEKYQEKETA